jgi:hypothetical protein
MLSGTFTRAAALELNTESNLISILTGLLSLQAIGRAWISSFFED